jgi:hypothetical protein
MDITVGPIRFSHQRTGGLEYLSRNELNAAQAALAGASAMLDRHAGPLHRGQQGLGAAGADGPPAD